MKALMSSRAKRQVLDLLLSFSSPFCSSMTGHSSHGKLTLLLFSIASCCWPFLSTCLLLLPLLGLSSSNPTILAVVFVVF